MADACNKEAMTNTTPKSCVDVNCDCNTMWSLAQQATAAPSYPARFDKNLPPGKPWHDSGRLSELTWLENGMPANPQSPA